MKFSFFSSICSTTLCRVVLKLWDQKLFLSKKSPFLTGLITLFDANKVLLVFNWLKIFLFVFSAQILREIWLNLTWKGFFCDSVCGANNKLSEMNVTDMRAMSNLNLKAKYVLNLNIWRRYFKDFFFSWSADVLLISATWRIASTTSVTTAQSLLTAQNVNIDCVCF